MVLATSNLFFQALWYVPFLSWETVINGFQAQTYEALTLTRESSVELVGTLQELPYGKTARGGHELSVDYWKVISMAPGGDDAFTNRVNEVTSFLCCMFVD